MIRPLADGQSVTTSYEQISVIALGMSAPRVAWIWRGPVPLIVTSACPEESVVTGGPLPVRTAPAAGAGVPSSP